MTEQELIKHFPSLEKGLIDEIIKVADVKALAAGELLMRTGQNIRSTLLVMDGLIKIYREDDQGNDFFYVLPGCRQGVRSFVGMCLGSGNQRLDGTCCYKFYRYKHSCSICK